MRNMQQSTEVTRLKKKRQQQEYSDVSNAVARDNFLAWEEFPEGAYGESIDDEKMVTNKNTPWREGQRFYSNYNFEDKTFHQNIPRQYPNAHPPHDDPDSEEAYPYEGTPDES